MTQTNDTTPAPITTKTVSRSSDPVAWLIFAARRKARPEWYLVKSFEDPAAVAAHNKLGLIPRIGLERGFRPVLQEWELKKLLSLGVEWVHGPDRPCWNGTVRKKIADLESKLRQQMEWVRQLEESCHRSSGPEK